MLLVSGKLANEKVTVDDSSPEGTARIRVVFDKDKLVSQEPASTLTSSGLKKLSISGSLAIPNSKTNLAAQSSRHWRRLRSGRGLSSRLDYGENCFFLGSSPLVAHYPFCCQVDFSSRGRTLRLSLYF